MSSAEEVLNLAVMAYYIAKIRIMRNRTEDFRNEDLSKVFPDHYRKLSDSGYYLYEGETADQIIDRYLKTSREPTADLPQRHGSDPWGKLARQVVERGEKLYEDRKR
jgi:hypothetical protein